MVAIESSGGVRFVGAPATASRKAFNWYVYEASPGTLKPYRRPLTLARTRWKYCGAAKLRTDTSPRSPTTRAEMLSRVEDHIDVRTRPVAPSGNASSIVMAR